MTSLSLAQLRNVSTTLRIAVDLQTLNFIGGSYRLFISLIEDGLRYSAQELAKQKNVVKGMTEDQITLMFVAPLKAMAFDVAHSRNNGGNTDISIEGPREMVWLGEAKKFSSYGKLLSGYQQLTDRYSSGLDGQNQGGFLIYHFSQNTKRMMEQWCKYLADVYPNVVISGKNSNTLEFVSASTHAGSGLPYTVRHIPIVLFHKPTDTMKPPRRAI